MTVDKKSGRNPLIASRRAAAFLPSESAVQNSIVKILETLGYTAKQIGRWVRQVRCPHCHSWFTPQTGYGNTPGTPDLIVSHERIVRELGGPYWLGIECKAPGGKSALGTIRPGQIRKEQRELADAGMIAIVHSVEEALTVVGEEDRLR